MQTTGTFYLATTPVGAGTQDGGQENGGTNEEDVRVADKDGKGQDVCTGTYM